MCPLEMCASSLETVSTQLSQAGIKHTIDKNKKVYLKAKTPWRLPTSMVPEHMMKALAMFQAGGLDAMDKRRRYDALKMLRRYRLVPDRAKVTSAEKRGRGRQYLKDWRKGKVSKKCPRQCVLGEWVQTAN